MEFNSAVNSDVMKEAVKVSSGDSLVVVASLGAAAIVGGLTCKFVVEPAITKIKDWAQGRRINSDFIDDEKITDQFEEED